MFNRKAAKLPLIVVLIKKTWYKWLKIFQNWNPLKEKWKMN